MLRNPSVRSAKRIFFPGPDSDYAVKTAKYVLEEL